MQKRMAIDILPQPDETTCGPTCLHAIYNYYNDDIPLEQLIQEIRRLRNGGTLAVFLACHALQRGFSATMYTYNLEMFDPTWFDEEVSVPDIRARLNKQRLAKGTLAITAATEGYDEFLGRGGRLKFEDLSPHLIRRYLKRGVPILTGLSATYLYRTAREYGSRSEYDEFRGNPTGHFVVLGGYRVQSRSVLIIDPLHPNPMAPGQYYEINIDRVIGAILLGVLTHDANLLVIEPARQVPSQPHVRIHSRQ